MPPRIAAALAALVLPFAAAGQVLLDDFSGPAIRKNRAAPPDDLWFAYLGEDPGQTYGLKDGRLWVKGDPKRNIYLTFFPIPYVWPTGFLQYYVKSGSFKPETNRMRFIVRCDDLVKRRGDGGNTIDLGTYVKPHSDSDRRRQGMHYYHGFNPNIYPGRWLLFIINSHPQHIVGQPLDVPGQPNDPEWARPTGGEPVHYFDGMTRFYFNAYGGGGRGSSFSGVTCEFDDFYLWHEDGEPDALVSSITATHGGAANGDRYAVSWAGPGRAQSYEIRYSTTSMKGNGFKSGTAGGSAQSRGDRYAAVYWESPRMPEQPDFYVAIRPKDRNDFTEIRIPALNAPPAAR